MTKTKFFAPLMVAAFVAAGYVSYGAYSSQLEDDTLLLENVEALATDRESGAKCPNGCRDIGWGWNKILECDCNYDHFSSCKSWGC